MQSRFGSTLLTAAIDDNPTTTFSSYLPQASLGSCVKNCSLAYPGFSYVSWFSVFPSTEITAATVILVINNATNTTSTITESAGLPPGYTLPPTNAEGKQIVVATDLNITGMGTHSTLYDKWCGFCHVQVLTKIVHMALYTKTMLINTSSRACCQHPPMDRLHASYSQPEPMSLSNLIHLFPVLTIRR